MEKIGPIFCKEIALYCYCAHFYYVMIVIISYLMNNNLGIIRWLIIPGCLVVVFCMPLWLSKLGENMPKCLRKYTKALSFMVCIALVLVETHFGDNQAMG